MRTHAHTRTYTPRTHAHTHARMRTHAHTRTHTPRTEPKRNFLYLFLTKRKINEKTKRAKRARMDGVPLLAFSYPHRGHGTVGKAVVLPSPAALVRLEAQQKTGLSGNGNNCRLPRGSHRTQQHSSSSSSSSSKELFGLQWSCARCAKTHRLKHVWSAIRYRDTRARRGGTR